MVVRDVRNIGCIREMPPSTIASINSIPLSIFLFILSTNTIESFTTIPDKETIPIKARNENGISSKFKPNITPTNESGTVNRIRNGCLNELNCKTKITAINTTDKIIDKNISVNDCCMSSTSPPTEIE